MTTEPRATEPRASEWQDRRYRLTALAMFAERTLPELLPAAGIAALFLILSWIGVFESLEPLWRMALGLTLAALFTAFCLPLRHAHYPSRSEIERRLDRSSQVFHRPLATLADELADSGTAKNDAFASTLWQVHRQRAEAARAALQAEPADIPTRRKDRYALRAGVLLALIASAFVAGDERSARIAGAFDWSTPRVPPAPPRLDAWIDPPAYTGRPPIFLSSAAGAQPDEVIRTPIGSTLTIRATVPRIEGKDATSVGAAPVRLELLHGAGLEVIQETTKEAAKEATRPEIRTSAERKPSGVTLEKRIIRADGTIRVRLDGRDAAIYTLAVIPDLPPKAVLNEVKIETASPQRQTQGGIRIAYALEDDYGIAKAEAVIERANPPEGKPTRTLFPPPEISVPLRLGPGEIILPTEDHPWAGEEVRVRLRIEDDLGQTSESEARTIALPQRPFTQGLAKALVEQRRDLNFSPDDLAAVRLAFDALLFEPERYTAKIGDFLALDLIRAGLRTARSEERLRDLSDQIYDLALFIENGDMTDAEKRLREAEARLREALERDASPEEIKRLAEELRRAMDQFLREFAERALRDPDRNAQDQSPISPERMLTQRDLADMLRKIEEMARSGNTAEAQKLLNQLKQVLENLRTARRQAVDPRMRELGQQLEELDRLQREQRDLRDRTFREGQQRGQRQPGQRQQGQRGQQRDGQQSQDGQQSLQDQQQALRERLKRLRERLQQRGMQEGEGFGDAEQGMGDAEGQLGQGNPGEATEGQGRALDGLGRAAQGMAQELQRQMGEGEGEGDGEGLGQPGPGQRGRAENRIDPLGRPRSSQRRDLDDNSRMPDDSLGDTQGSISERAERVLRELRKRLGEFERPREELDYLERLLRQR